MKRKPLQEYGADIGDLEGLPTQIPEWPHTNDKH